MKNPKIVKIEEILKLIKSQDEIVVGMAANEPREFMKNLHIIADKVKNVTVTNCLPIVEAEFFTNEKLRDSFFLDSWFFTKTLRSVSKNGNISFIPNHLHLAGRRRLDHKIPNIFITAATPPDKHGFMSLSTSNVYEKQMVEEADIVVFEINPNFPRTFGDMEVHVHDVDYLVEVDYQVPTLPYVEPNEKDMIIGKLIADKINDGDTIQLGIGGIPNAVARSLMTKKDLGIHTEMFTSGMIDLIEAGVITGKKKTLHKGKHVCCFAMGSKELYEYIDNNPSVMILPGSYVNDPAVMALNDNQVSINATIEVDLTGQCASESVGTKQISGTGGQADTAIGAQNAKNGRSFIALYSTATIKNKETGALEEVSKIVPTLTPGAAVSLSRADVDYVVTEYGIVRLRGTNVRERAKLLISIAHPKFRDELRKQAIEAGYLHEHF